MQGLSRFNGAGAGLIGGIRIAFSFLQQLLRRIVEDDCLRSAAALTYLSLFALVPTMTVVYSVLSIVPAFSATGAQLEQFLFTHFVPNTGREIRQYLQQFSQQARQLSGVGVVFLVVTAYGMLSNIERTFNAIWRAPPRRGGLSSLMRHWMVLSLGPLCMGVALAVSTYLLSLQMLNVAGIPGLKELMLRATPWLLTSAAFTLIYLVVPNARVRTRDAAIGGVIAALGFELAKKLFAFVLASSYQRVYGTFAALPLFLLWIYLSWIIVLLGAELVFVASGYSHRHSRDLPDLLVALALLERLWQKHRRGESADLRKLLREPWLLHRYMLPVGHWARLREPMTRSGLIKVAANGDILLGRDLGEYSLWQLAEVLALVPGPFDLPSEGASDAWLLHFTDICRQWRKQDSGLLNQSLASLFADKHPSAPPSRDDTHPA